MVERIRYETVAVLIPKDILNELDSLVKNRIFNTRSEAIKYAVISLLRKKIFEELRDKVMIGWR